MINKFIFLFSLWIYLFLSSYIINGQTHITGKVQEELTHKPVEFAYVTLQRIPDSVSVAFSQTKETGVFDITFTPKQGQLYYLSISHISYKKNTYLLDLAQTPQSKINISLTPYDFILNEIQVVKKISIREQGDSTRYKMSAFVKGNENNLEEVLKKMPNIRVLENGDIFFKNKRVEKIFLDGDDIIGNTYQLATRSINPNLLNEVQVVENFSENRLLQQIAQSDKTILNLTVKEEMKTLFLGTVDIGLGIQRHNVLSSLFSYHKKFKAFSVISSNNVGINKIELTNENFSINSFDESPAIQQKITPFLATERPFARYLNSPLENINNEKIASFNLATNLIKDLKITTNLTYYKDNLNFQNNRYSKFLGNSPFSYQQNDTLRQNPSFLKIGMNITYNWSKNVALSYKVISSAKNINANQNTSFFNDNERTQITPSSNIDLGNFAQYFDLTYKLNNTNALNLSFQHKYGQNKDFLSTTLNPLLAFKLANNDTINQTITQQNKVYSGQLKWLFGNKRWKLEQHIGFLSGEVDNFNGSIGLTKRNEGSFELSQKVSYYRSIALLKWKSFEISGKLELDYLQTTLNNTVDEKYALQSKFVLSYRLDDLNKFILSYNRSTSPISNHYLFNNYLVSDFRTSQKGNRNDGLLFDEQKQLSFNYIFSDVLDKKMTFSSNFFIVQYDKYWGMSNYEIQPQFTTSTLINTPNVYTLGINLFFEKLIFPLSGNIKIDIRFLQNRFEQIINENAQISNSYSPIVSIKHITALNSPFNFEIGGTYKYTALKFSQNQLIQSFTNSSAFLNANYRNKKYFLSISVENNWVNSNGYFFLKASANYKFSDKMTVSIEGVNLLNKTSFQMIDITPSNYSETIYSLIPSYSLFHLKYSF